MSTGIQSQERIDSTLLQEIAKWTISLIYLAASDSWCVERNPILVYTYFFESDREEWETCSTLVAPDCIYDSQSSPFYIIFDELMVLVPEVDRQNSWSPTS